MNHTVLIVDDDNDVRERYREVFKENGFSVIEARNGVEGLDIALEKRPNLIFTGIIMPKMDGFDMIKHLKDDIRTTNIPIMISSHLGRQEDKIKAQGLGIKDFILLDFTPPIDVVRLARLRIEGDKEEKYLLDVNEISLDAARLTRDFNFPPYLKCDKHSSEKMVLVLSADPENAGVFKAKFICPQEK
ncbi:MAG: response regulator [Patescibacteria group bacterium]